MFAAVYDEVMAACISHTDMTKQSVIENYQKKIIITTGRRVISKQSSTHL